MREQTQELATWTLFDSGSIKARSSQGRSQKPLSEASTSPCGRSSSVFSDPDPRSSSESNRPEAIPEVSEPTSPEEQSFFEHRKLPVSVLSNVFKSSSTKASSSDIGSSSKGQTSNSSHTGEPYLVIKDASALKSGEAEPLVSKDITSNAKMKQAYGSIGDVESQNYTRKKSRANEKSWWEATKKIFDIWQNLLHSKIWTQQGLWENFVLAPVYAIPAVLLGLLLNLLDALSYGTYTKYHVMIHHIERLAGMILFPLGEKIFEHTGADGISMFYVSCIVSQLVYSGGGSVFKGGVGSEMVSRGELYFMSIDLIADEQ